MSLITPPQHPRVVPHALHTQRLLLRPFAPTDAPALHEALVESIDQLRAHLWFLPWVAQTPTLTSALVRCEAARTHFEQRSDLAYLAFERQTGRLVASAGLHRTDWTLPKTEVGYWVRSSEVGRGYATEAVNALTDWALDRWAAQRVELVTDETNWRSRAVALRCGFGLESVQPQTMPRAAGQPAGQTLGQCLYVKRLVQEQGG